VRAFGTKIFISYRREDGASAAGRLYDRLAKLFGQESVFIDVNKIPLGSNFPSYLDAQLAKCSVFLSVIGRDWLNVKDNEGARRIDKSDDFVRIEIVKPIKLNLKIIPVLVDGAQLPKAIELPDVLRPLVLFSAAELRHSSFDRDSEALIEQFEGVLFRLRRRRWLIASVGGTFVLFAFILLGYLWLTKPQLMNSPSGVALIDPTSSATEAPFEMATLPGAQYAVNLVGTYSVNSGSIIGKLEEGVFHTAEDFRVIFPTISALAFQACYLHVIGGVDQINRFPLVAKEDNSEPLDIVVESFQLPRDAQVNRTWLCAALINDGGFMPLQ
jgi:TIR domain